MSKIEIRQSVGIRLFIIGLLTLVLLIPTVMIQSLITERKERRDEVAFEISENWGGKQLLIGPILSIPFKYQRYDDQNNIFQSTGYAHFLPEKLNIKGVINPEIRNRGMYEIVMYNSQLDISGVFDAPDFNEFNISSENILWEDALISIGISDMKGIRDPVTIQWNNENCSANPGVETKDIFPSGMSIKANLTDMNEKYNFNAELNLNGSFELLFTPIGKETRVELLSDWTNPSFTGDFLPVDREISKNGFSSSWRILHVSRDFPQQWLGSEYEINNSVFGVSLLLSVDEYQKTTRTVKYAIMFISLTFLTFFVIEVLSKKVIHPIQYLLIGFALLLFYTLLLSLSEHIAFKFAYLIASAGITTLISLYAKSVLSDKLQSLIISAILAILYGYLYIILQLQDYALLMGSLVLFIALAMVMYLTRKIDWYTVMNVQKSEEHK